jgi:serine/threonine protein kinase
MDGEPEETRFSFWNLSQGIDSSHPVQADKVYDLITFLAACQNAHVDILPITWRPALGGIGTGATATIQQSLIDPQTSFAFKKVHSSRRHPLVEAKTYKSLVSEVTSLGNQSLRHHQNIVRLEGVCWDFPKDDGEIWPVLVFEKYPLGDLERFLNSNTGHNLGMATRIKLCMDLLSALETLQQSGKI